MLDTPTPRRWWLRPRALAWWMAIGVGLVVFGVGATTDLSIGDENYHFRKAVQFYEHGERLTYDPDYGKTVPPGITYYDGALWPGLLALLWYLTGPSVAAAQAYQAAWTVLLVGCAWEAGQALGGNRTAWWAMLVTATLPAFLAFGVLLYVEVALIALLMAAAALTLRHHPFWAGFLFGLAFLIKPTVPMVFPAFLLAVLLTAKGGRRGCLVAALAACTGTALLVLPELAWRHIYLGTIGVVRLSEENSAAVPAVIRTMLAEKGPETFYEPSSLFNLLDLIKYLGGIVIVGLAVALRPGFWRRRQRAGLELVLAAVLVVYVGLLPWSRMFEVRYLMPAFVPVALLAAVGLTRLRPARGWLACGLLILAILQAALALRDVAQRRHLPADLREAMAEVGRLPDYRHTPCFVVNTYPYLTTYSGKLILWAVLNPNAFFFHWSPEQQWQLLDYYGVDYFVIPRDRIYDDTAIQHTGGFPASFVHRLPDMPYVDRTPVLDRGGLLVYRVRPQPFETTVDK